MINGVVHAATFKIFQCRYEHDTVKKLGMFQLRRKKNSFLFFLFPISLLNFGVSNYFKMMTARNTKYGWGQTNLWLSHNIWCISLYTVSRAHLLYIHNECWATGTFRNPCCTHWDADVVQVGECIPSAAELQSDVELLLRGYEGCVGTVQYCIYSIYMHKVFHPAHFSLSIQFSICRCCVFFVFLQYLNNYFMRFSREICVLSGQRWRGQCCRRLDSLCFRNSDFLFCRLARLLHVWWTAITISMKER